MARSDLDQQQIIQKLYDESANRLRVDAEISASIIAPPGLEVSIAAADDNIAIRNSNNSNELLINADGSINVVASGGGGGDVTVINGAGVSAVNIQDGGNSITVDGSVSVSNFPATQDVNITNSSIAVTGPLTDTQLRATAVPVSGTFWQATQPISGSVTANIGTSGSLALNSSLTTINTTLGSPFQAGGSIGNTSFIVTQGTGSNLHTVVDSGSITVGNASGASAVNIQDGGNSITVDGSISFTAPQHIIADSGTISTITNVVHVDDNGGSLTVDNNGTFAVQATLATETTKVIGTVNISSGQTVAATWPAIASAAVTSVASSASNVTLLASNSSRSMGTFYNDSTSSVYLKFGATATTSSFTIKMTAASYYELPTPIYTGQIDAIWDSANGSMRITEY